MSRQPTIGAYTDGEEKSPLTEDDLDKTKDEEEPLTYGWGRMRPQCLQFLNKPKWFLFGICAYTMFQAISIIGLTNLTLPSIEKRFSLSAKELGGIAAANDVSAILVVLFVSFYGDYGNKIKWIGGGGILLGCGTLLYISPHFLIGDYKPRQFGSGGGGLCRAAGQTSLGADVCSEESDARWYYVMILVVGQIIIGTGISPFYALVPAYLDENVRPKYMPLYIGAWQCALWLGPGIGLAIGGKFLSIYVDITQPPGVSLTQRDPQWIGAWWLGFVISGSLIIASSIFVLGFPKQMPGAKEIRQEAIKKGHVRKGNSLKTPSLRMLLPELWSLLTNWTFIFNTFGLTVLLLMAGGLLPFLPKSIMLLYGLKPEEAGYALSLMLSPTMIVGITMGSFIIKRFSLKDLGKKAAFVILAIRVMGALLPLSFLVPGCRQVTLAGLNKPIWKNNSATNHISVVPRTPLTTSCNMECGCSLSRFTPVCGSDNMTYLDSCHAGCSARASEKSFMNCSCIPSRSAKNEQGTAKFGYCDLDCKNFIFFGLIIATSTLIGFMRVVPEKTVILRCVPDNKRAFASGVQYIIVKTVGLLPGPIVVGHIFDSACLLWQDTCGTKGRCFVHDIEKLTMTIVTFGVTATAITVVLYFLSWYLYKPEQEEQARTVVPFETGRQPLTDKSCEETNF